MTNIDEKVLGEKLHEWYLEVTAQLNPKSFNKEAQKPYRELTGEQQTIDKYIAGETLKYIYQRLAEEAVVVATQNGQIITAIPLTKLAELFGIDPSKSNVGGNVSE